MQHQFLRDGTVHVLLLMLLTHMYETLVNSRRSAQEVGRNAWNSDPTENFVLGKCLKRCREWPKMARESAVKSVVRASDSFSYKNPLSITKTLYHWTLSCTPCYSVFALWISAWFMLAKKCLQMRNEGGFLFEFRDWSWNTTLRARNISKVWEKHFCAYISTRATGPALNHKFVNNLHRFGRLE